MATVNPQISPRFRKLAQDWCVWTPHWSHKGSRSYLCGDQIAGAIWNSHKLARRAEPMEGRRNRKCRRARTSQSRNRRVS